MDHDQELAQLREEVQQLKDRAAILDCLNRHARGHDRHDAALISSAYHPDGFDEHGHAINSGSEYAAWINPVHAAGSQNHQHHLTTYTCEIDGDVAHCESYVLVCLLNHDGITARVISGRYIDRLEKRDGDWRIAVRRSTVEMMFTADASMLATKVFLDQGYSKGVRDHSDLSYVRPLTIDAAAPALW